MLTHKNKKPITTWSDWPNATHMKDERSAKELAKHWTRTSNIPDDVERLLHTRFGTLELKKGNGIPELGTQLPPKGSNGSRMHDLWLKLHHDEAITVTVCVEAKADEPFDQDIAHFQKQAQATLAKNPKSKQFERLQILQKMLWPTGTPSNIGTLKYQLLSALTGTAIQTLKDGSQYGMLLFHIFNTSDTLSIKRSRNDRDLYAFLDSLSLHTHRKHYTTREGHFFGRAEVHVPTDFSPTGKPRTVHVEIAKLSTFI